MRAQIKKSSTKRSASASKKDSANSRTPKGGKKATRTARPDEPDQEEDRRRHFGSRYDQESGYDERFSDQQRNLDRNGYGGRFDERPNWQDERRQQEDSSPL